LLTYITRTGGGAIAGLLIGVTYYRYRAWRGTALLLVTALPALAAQESISGLLRGHVQNELLLTSLASSALLLLAPLASHLLTRAVPINLPRRCPSLSPKPTPGPGPPAPRRPSTTSASPAKRGRSWRC